MSRYFADVNVQLRVYFDDNGSDDLNDQAIEAVLDNMNIPDEAGVIEDNGLQLVGNVEKLV